MLKFGWLKSRGRQVEEQPVACAEGTSAGDGDNEATSISTRRGVFAAAAAVAAVAGLRATPAKATADLTVNTASTAAIGILASTGATGSPITPQITAGTTHSIIGSQSSLTVIDMDSGVAGVRAGAGRAGVYGANGGDNGYGVVGKTASGIGVYGESNISTGVTGKSSSNFGVLGVSDTSTAVRGQSNTGYGLQGVSTSNNGVRASSSTNTALVAQNNKTNVPALLATNAAASGAYAGRFVGRVRVEGDFAVVGGAKAAGVYMPDGTLATMYCQESPEPFFEDFGQATLQNGAAKVTIDPEFASLITTDRLMIFLTPEGESEMLYVHAKGPEGFEVREARGGRSNHSFSWRLVAKRKDITGERLARMHSFDEVDVAERDDFDPAAILAAASTRDPNQLSG